jgi:hypothetical protein
MTAQNKMDHYNKKLAEEQAKLAKAEEVAAEVESEFEVNIFWFLVLICIQFYSELAGKG